MAAVVDRHVGPAECARLIVGRLADEFPAERVDLTCLLPPAWCCAASVDPSVPYADVFGGIAVVPPAWSTRDEPEAIERLAAFGIHVTGRWAPGGWRATLREVLRRGDGYDLLLVVTRRRRRLPSNAGRLRVEPLGTRPRRSRPAAVRWSRRR